MESEPPALAEPGPLAHGRSRRLALSESGRSVLEDLATTVALCYVDGSRETANAEKLKEAHKRVMVANHPDAGGSHYLASKINEAKDVLTGKTKGGGSAF
ncbi:unnamed protein product [Miscanthus lutarioriparius]|uniref:J domain-containing protein n=1 Tax=Miscanthus lutarioriparius TaxID=422564 RepID=A0A811R7S6_9POAL|nr:unnamed protein product [Miscanthus lutarioriparius]